MSKIHLNGSGAKTIHHIISTHQKHTQTHTYTNKQIRNFLILIITNNILSITLN